MWLPIETAPRDGTKIIAYTVHGEIEITDWYEIEQSHYEEIESGPYCGLFRKITDKPIAGWNSGRPLFWLPLPKVPEEATP